MGVDYINLDYFQVNIAIKNTFNNSSNFKGYILLYKTFCLRDWFNCFINRRSGKVYIKLNCYSFILIIEAGFISVKLTANNCWYKDSGLIYNKVYNINKEMFIMLLKKWGLYFNF